MSGNSDQLPAWHPQSASYRQLQRQSRQSRELAEPLTGFERQPKSFCGCDWLHKLLLVCTFLFMGATGFFVVVWYFKVQVPGTQSGNCPGSGGHGPVPNGTADTDIDVRRALANLYFSTQPGWERCDDPSKVRWLSYEHHCNWQCISCAPNGQILSIDLHANGKGTSKRMNGTIPTDLFALNGIEELNLAGNHLTSTVPPSLGDLTSLQKLDLGDNALTGTIPIRLAFLAALQNLTLSQNRLGGNLPPQLASLTNLNHLEVQHNKLGGSIPGNWPNSLMSSLQHLDLSFNQMTGSIPAAIASNMPSLQTLQVSYNKFNGSLPEKFSTLSELQTLDFSNNEQLKGPLPKMGLPMKLKELLGSHCGLTSTLPSEIGSLGTMLEKIRLDNNQLSGAVPDEWDSLTAVTTIDMSNNLISSVGNNQDFFRANVDYCSMANNPPLAQTQRPKWFPDSCTWPSTQQ